MQSVKSLLAMNFGLSTRCNRNAFFQMHIESGLIEYWTDGVMQHQQSGDIDDAKIS